MRNSAGEEIGQERDNTAFKHFGPLQKQKMGAGPKLASTLIVASVMSLLILFSISHAKMIQQKIEDAKLTFVTPQEPPPPPPPIHIAPPPPMEIKTTPRIVVPHDEPAPVIKPPQLKMNIPVPVLPAAPPKKVVPAAAPKMVALNAAPASVPNNYNKPTAVALGDPNALKAAPNATPKAGAVSLGMAGMPARNNGAGAAGAKSVSLGSGAPNGSAGGTDRGRAVSGVSLGVAGGQGTGPTRSTSAVAIGSLGPAVQQQQRVIAAAPTTPVTITFTPHPAYTPQATANRISGVVDVEVIFHANGSVQVIRVVRGLGYGLDQNALIAAANIRFKPAMQNGQPVDQHSIVHIQFQTLS